MENLTFTELGYLYPHEKITIDVATFEQVFVKDFPNSETRKTLFDNYLRYLDAFSKEITPHFTQWINGSFVTEKENPKDIDFVTFIDVDIFNRKYNNLEKYWSFACEKEGLDAYILEIYPINHEQFESYTRYHQNNWYKLFNHDRFDEFGLEPPKGFVEIIFE